MIRVVKLLKGRIKNKRIIPPKIDPIMLTISEGSVSLTIFPLVS